MRIRKGKKRRMAFKIDMEKAYDRLRWDFIKDTLEDAQMPQSFVRVIMQCLSTSSMQMLWNGGFTNEFSPMRGVRQGDPSSPYLFALAMEKLGHAINFAISNGEWKPIKMGRNGPSLSHLFFADDMVLFGEASVENARCIQTI